MIDKKEKKQIEDVGVANDLQQDSSLDNQECKKIENQESLSETNNSHNKSNSKKELSDKAKLSIAIAVSFVLAGISLTFGITLGKIDIVKIGSIISGIIFWVALIWYILKINGKIGKKGKTVKKSNATQPKKEEKIAEVSNNCDSNVTEKQAQKAKKTDKVSEDKQEQTKNKISLISWLKNKLFPKDKKNLSETAKIENRRFRLVFLLVISPFVLILVGGGLCPYYSVGFWIMGLGFATFIGGIIGTLIWQNLQRSHYCKYLKIDKSLLKDYYDIHEGIVTKFSPHSSHSGRARGGRYDGPLFQIYVFILTEENKNKYKKRKPKLDYKTQPKMLCHSPLEVGDRVKFYQNKNKPKDCYFISKIKK